MSYLLHLFYICICICLIIDAFKIVYLYMDFYMHAFIYAYFFPPLLSRFAAQLKPHYSFVGFSAEQPQQKVDMPCTDTRTQQRPAHVDRRKRANKFIMLTRCITNINIVCKLMMKRKAPCGNVNLTANT